LGAAFPIKSETAQTEKPDTGKQTRATEAQRLTAYKQVPILGVSFPIKSETAQKRNPRLKGYFSI